MKTKESLAAKEVSVIGLLDWFRRRKKRKPEEEELLERTGKLRTEIEEHVEEKPKRATRKRKKESA